MSIFVTTQGALFISRRYLAALILLKIILVNALTAPTPHPPKSISEISACVTILKAPDSSCSNVITTQQKLFEILTQITSDESSDESVPPTIISFASLYLADSYIKFAHDEMAVETLLNIPPTSEEEIMLLGGCYTRLRRYDEAMDLYRKNGCYWRCRYSELLSCLKVNDLKKFEERYIELNINNSNSSDFSNNTVMNIEANTFEALASISRKPSVTPKNIFDDQSKILLPSLLNSRRTVPTTIPQRELLLRLASINALPVHGIFFSFCENKFDDKRGFHHLLSASSISPPSALIESGLVTDSRVEESKEQEINNWFVKRPFSWGGWGVEFINDKSFLQASEIVCKRAKKGDLVLQEAVDTLKIDGSAFSIRLYVIYRDDKVFFSKDCLVKFASGEDGKITNSAFNIAGGGGRQIEGWKMITDLLGASRVNDQIENMVQVVFSEVNVSNMHIPSPHIPKILGFDLLVERSTKSLKLIEINATPGLVARNQSGAEFDVKRKVLEEAWGTNVGHGFVEVKL
ncbi:hypothetical protein TrVE_jg4591 [Triparma verrucosa]|uniref:Uncharacterized protein n=1 Tax=Triparma verrucosa TaxID=1606542 RepID=A0A9W7F8V0_9STRA|nr:hypothetical protein TrVE_jg4591 [Triparma verrucosa]